MLRFVPALLLALGMMGCHSAGNPGGRGAGGALGSGGKVAGVAATTTSVGGVIGGGDTSTGGSGKAGATSGGGATSAGGATGGDGTSSGGPGRGGATSTGGVVGAGGAVVAGGARGTGGSPSSGGASGTGGATSTGGTLGTGGSTSVTCTPACTSSSTCCDGSDESCDGTRLPSGDGTNPGEFVISADGLTVTDTITGLVWQRDGSGARAACITETDNTCEWYQAQAYCASLSLGGISGWRLPAVMELSTIVDFTVTTGVLIDAATFPNTPAGRFWTSSPYAGTSDKWFIDFGNGFTFNSYVGANYRVRCVR